MLSVSIKHDFNETIRLLDGRFSKQIPFAIAKTLTDIAKLGQDAVGKAIVSNFDRPTPFTQKSTFIKPATKQNLRAMVYIKDQSPGGKSAPLSETIGHEFAGGVRIRKRIEYWLQRAGYISPNEFVAPGAGAKLDQYGNMSQGQIQQILSQLRAGPDSYANKSDSKRSRKNVRNTGGFFWSRGGKLARGVWQRYSFAHGGAVKPVLLVISTPHYRQRIDMQKIVDSIVSAKFDALFRANLENAVLTAR